MKDIIWKSLDFPGEAVDLLHLFKEEPYLFFLDSSLLGSHNGRFSFIGFDPFAVFSDHGKNPLKSLKKRFLEYKLNDSEAPSPLGAGLVGFFSYDAGLYFEKIQRQARDDLGLPDCFFGFYDCIITIDHFARKLYLCSSGLPEKNSWLRQRKAEARIKDILTKLSGYPGHALKDPHEMDAVRSFNWTDIEKSLSCNFTKENYLNAVRKALDYIARGDVYQVNLSQRFKFTPDDQHRQPDFIKLYKLLRRISPTHFGCYLDGGDFQIMSNSPERFLRLQDNIVQTRPMKGTRSRGANIEEDRKLKEELFRSPKERAELLMITDLERNDLGRVCEFGSVKVKDMRTLEEYRTVFQATSTVEGILRKDKDAFDVIAACFPGGSVTGCPKIRAMEIIEELEPTRRGIYTGAFGYMSFNGSMDFNILIRTLLAHKGKIHFHVGGGVVADSIPEKEYEETLVKANAMGACLKNIFFKKEELQLSR